MDILELKNITENMKFALWVAFTKSPLPTPPSSFRCCGSGPPLLASASSLSSSAFFLSFCTLLSGVMLFTCYCSSESCSSKPIRGLFLIEELQVLGRHCHPLRCYHDLSTLFASPTSPECTLFQPSCSSFSDPVFLCFFCLSICNAYPQFFLIIPPVFSGRNLTYQDPHRNVILLMH